MTVHLVNLTNPMLMKGPIREIIPLPPQKVKVTIPKGWKAKAVHTLVSREQLAPGIIGSTVELELKAVGLHEVIAIDLVRV